MGIGVGGPDPLVISKRSTGRYERVVVGGEEVSAFIPMPLPPVPPPRHPVVTVASAMALIDTSKPTAIRSIEALVDAGVLVETTGKKRDRSFAYQAYVNRLRVGTELER